MLCHTWHMIGSTLHGRSMCCGDMLHWTGNGKGLAYGVGEYTQHLEVRHAFGSCRECGMCVRIYV